MKCMIIEDEPPAIKVLEHYIDRVPILQACGSFTDPLAGMSSLQQTEIDLLFLDINMPGLSGIELIKTLHRPPMIVLTTAYPEYAIEGYELEVLDYLLKPISFERFLKAVNKAGKTIQGRSPAASAQQDHIILKADRKLFKVDLQDIMYLQAWGDYVKIFCKDRIILPKETLRKIEQRLPRELFVRTHRSYIVAVSAISFIEGNQVAVGDGKLPISQSYKENLMKYFS